MARMKRKGSAATASTEESVSANHENKGSEQPRATASTEDTLDANHGKKRPRSSATSRDKESTEVSADANRREKSRKPRQDKRKVSMEDRFKSYTCRNNPKNLQILYNSIEPSLKERIRATSFGHTLGILINVVISRALIWFLIQKVDTKNGKLKLGKEGNHVEIDLKKACRKAFCLPHTGNTIPVDDLANGTTSMKGQDTLLGSPSKTKNHVAGEGVQIYIKNKLVGCTDPKSGYKYYLYSVVSWLFSPSSTNQIERRFKNILENVENVREWNWSDFLVDLLVKSIKGVISGATTYLLSCPFLLVIIFLDMIDFSALQDQECSEGPATVIAEGFPRACYITDDNVQWLSKQKGKWDDLPIKQLDDSVYSDTIHCEEWKGDDNFEDNEDDGGKEDNDPEDQPDMLRDKPEQYSYSQQMQVAKDNLTKLMETGLQDVKAELEKANVEFFAKFEKDSAYQFNPEVKIIVMKLLQEMALAKDKAAISSCESNNRHLFKNVINFVKPMDKFLDKPGHKKAAIRQNGKKKKECTVLFRYPSAKHVWSIQLRCEDIECLTTNGDATDSIVDLYALHLNGKLPLCSIDDLLVRPKYHIVTPFCWQCIAACKGPKDFRELPTNNPGLGFDGININELTCLFLTVSDVRTKHFSLVTVYLPKTNNGSISKCYVMHMDSIEGCHDSKHIFNVVKGFLEYTLGVTSEIKQTKVQVPSQGPTQDCVFFVLHNMERVILEMSDFRATDFQKSKCKKFGEKWYEPKDASKLRGEIKNLIHTYKLAVTYDVKKGMVCSFCKTASKHKEVMEEYKGAFSAE